MEQGVKLFYSYAQEDKAYREKIDKHLHNLKIKGCLHEWHEGKVEPGDVVADEILKHLEKSQIILLLISPDYIASDKQQRELKIALQQHQLKASIVIPIIVRSTDWENTSFGNLNPLPSNGIPIDLWKNQDQAFLDVCRGITARIKDKLSRVHHKKAEHGLIDEQKLDIKRIEFTKGSSPPSAIEQYNTTINKFIYSLIQPYKNPEHINANPFKDIRELLGADFVYVSRLKDGFVPERDKSDKNHPFIPTHQLDLELKSKLKLSFNSEAKFRDIWLENKFYRLDLELKSSEKNELYYINFIPIPNKNDQNLKALVIIQNKNSNEILNHLSSLVIRTIFIESKGFNDFSKPLDYFKSKIYDSIKIGYGYVSDLVYQERFRIFKESIKNLKVFFEPIIEFESDHKSVDIWGWESLARDANGNKIPYVFQAAELWGIEFQTELDLICLENSIKQYRNLLDTLLEDNLSDLKVRLKNIQPLSINVYPNTLMRTKYKEKIVKLFKQYRIPGKKIIFEISEKTLLFNPYVNSDDIESYIEEFKAVMGDLRTTLKVEFAIDDFGVGNSSIVRLMKLTPEYVKIDRDIILLEKNVAKQIIKSFNDIRLNYRKIWKVIVEGLDSDSMLSLKDIVIDAGVDYIQGHDLLKGDFNIQTRLNNEAYKKISRKLGWD